MVEQALGRIVATLDEAAVRRLAGEHVADYLKEHRSKRVSEEARSE
jgi:hypothetical protein